MTLIYQPPWLCYIHNFYTQKPEEWFEHVQTVPHTASGSNAPCEHCGKKIRKYTVPWEGVNEPIIILCIKCQSIPNIREHVRAKRRAQFPPDKTVKSF